MAEQDNSNIFLTLPSIYKPFYIQRLYAVNLYSVESSRDSGSTLTESTNTITSVVNVYNGIGLLASTKFLTIDDFNNKQQILDKIDGFDKIDSVDSLIGKFENSSAIPKTTKNNFENNNVIDDRYKWYKDAKYENLKSRLYNYLGTDNSQLFFSGLPTGTTIETNDLYTIGLLEDKISIYDGLNKTYMFLPELNSSIYRNKPLILSDYNHSVMDVFKSVEPLLPIKNIGKMKLYSRFTSVNFSENNNIVNRNVNEERTINFGNLNEIDDDKGMNTKYARITIKVEKGDRVEGDKFVIDNVSGSTVMDEVIGIIGHFNTEIDKEVRYYVVNEAFINEYCKISENSNGYCKEYIDKREQYDLKMNEFTYSSRMTNFPFLNMIPALRNTKGYYYSSNDEVNEDFPFAMEVYCEAKKQSLPELGNTNYSSYYNLKINSFGIKYPTDLYLIGVYSPLTALSGTCCYYPGIIIDENTPYVREIKAGTELIPQIDSTTIIMNFGLVYEPTNSDEGGSGGSGVTPRT